MKKILSLFSFFVVFLMFGFIGGNANAVGVNTDVESITIKTAPKSTYIEGDKLDLNALVVSLKKANIATPADVSFVDFTSNAISVSISNGSTLRTTNTKVTITVNGKSVDQLITVSAIAKVEGISIKTNPTKVEYLVGEKLDLTGLSIELRKSSGPAEVVVFADTNPNPFSKYGITIMKPHGSVLTEKDTKVYLKMGKISSASFDIKVSVNLVCIAPSVAKREASIVSSFDKYTSSIKASLVKRTSAIVAAWAIKGNVERNSAIRVAWDVYKTEQKVAKSIRAGEVRTAWSVWKNDLKTCKIAPSMESQSADLLN